jgi:hypothetical protein
LVALYAGVQGLESRRESNQPYPLPSPIAPVRSEPVAAGRYKFWPQSAPVVEGIEYAFEVGHCGLEFLTDFDGSFWLPFESGRRNPPYVFYGNDDGVGKIVLVDVNRSVYTNFMGVEIPLRRVRGPVVTVPCA